MRVALARRNIEDTHGLPALWQHRDRRRCRHRRESIPGLHTLSSSRRLLCHLSAGLTYLRLPILRRPGHAALYRKPDVACRVGAVPVLPSGGISGLATRINLWIRLPCACRPYRRTPRVGEIRPSRGPQVLDNVSRLVSSRRIRCCTAQGHIHALLPAFQWPLPSVRVMDTAM
jgi:hypothetical protein